MDRKYPLPLDRTRGGECSGHDLQLMNLTPIADAVGRAPDVQAAFDTLIAEISGVLHTRACIFQRVERGWALVAQTRGGLGVPISDLHLALNNVPPGDLTARVDLPVLDEGVWTSMFLRDPGGPSVAVLLAGDWTILDGLNTLALLLEFALRSVSEREVRRNAERLLVAGYTMARNLGRLGALEIVCQRVVEHVSRSLEADRVAIALYRPEEDRLVVAATHGYPASIVKDVRITPGSWVLGHVYASGRPVLVTNIRKIKGMSLERRQYRTFSFAAVPIFGGAETVGVLCATDKKDGSTFDRKDTIALRSLSVSAALALMAARSDTEVRRLAYSATVDLSTGLFNRLYFDVRLPQELERAKRSSSSLMVLMVDVDDLKTINDTSGHQVGDAALKVIGNILRSAVRVFDVSARYGGDEFAILMLNSDRASAVACAERIRQRVSEYHAGGEDVPGLPRLTVSIGVAIVEMADSPGELIRRAESCLSQAKADGKNRVRVNSDLPDV